MSSNKRPHPILPMATFPTKGHAAASPLEQWAKRFQEAERLVEDVAGKVAEREAVPPSMRLELQRRTAEIRRKVAILETRMSLMQEDFSQLSEKQHISLKEMRKLAESFSALRGKVKEVAAPFTMKHSPNNRNDLLGPSDLDKCAAIDASSTATMEDREIVELQRSAMKKQDESLDRLEETIASTKHIALAINEELDLHAKLIDDLDDRTEETTHQLQRAQKKLKSLNRRMRESGSCSCILLAVIAAVICVAVVWALIQF